MRTITHVLLHTHATHSLKSAYQSLARTAGVARSQIADVELIALTQHVIRLKLYTTHVQRASLLAVGVMLHLIKFNVIKYMKLLKHYMK